MCLSPIYVKNPSAYASGLSYYGSECSCGKCDACLYEIKRDWHTRFAFEIKDIRSKGGDVVFLTFTFNDAHLPHFPAEIKELCDDNGNPLPCFDNEEVQKFKEVLRARFNRAYPDSYYRFFIASEYGKNTRRPHLHGMFFLGAGVDPDTFGLMARDAWNDFENNNPRGFMFPAWDGTKWIDNKGEASRIRIQSDIAATNYVQKYVLKDMSFYGLEQVDKYLHTEDGRINKAHKEQIKNCLPKHWQSVQLGYSLFDSLTDDTAKINALENGIVNPTTFKVVPLPTFAANRLIYKNVKSERLSTTIKKRVRKDDYYPNLYDRYLSEFGKRYMEKCFSERISKYKGKVLDFLHNYGVNAGLLSASGVDADAISNIIACSGLSVEDLAYRTSMFHVALSKFGNELISDVLSLRSLDELFDERVIYPYYQYNRDLGARIKDFKVRVYRKGEELPIQYTQDDDDVPYIVSHDYTVVEYVGDGASESTRYCGDLFKIESFIDKCFGTYSRYVSSLISDNYKGQQEIKDRLKMVLGRYKFDINLC